MGRMYSVSFSAVAVTAAQDLFDIAPADDKPCLIHAIYLSQGTELGDAAEEQLHIKLIRGLATVGSGGTAPTSEPLDGHDSASGATVRVNDTTQAVVGAGTTNVLWSEYFNVRSGWQYLPTPEMRIEVAQTNTRLVVSLVTAPTDSVTMSGVMIYDEL